MFPSREMEGTNKIGKIKGEKDALETLGQIRKLHINIISVADDTVWAAARLKMLYPISYADAFAVATAQDKKAILVTGDPEIARLNRHFQIEKLRREMKKWDG